MQALDTNARVRGGRATAMTKYLSHAVLDDFLPQDFHDGLLDFALNNRERFKPNRIYADSGASLDTSVRKSLYCKDGLGPLHHSFRDAVTSRFPELVQKLGMQTFKISAVELELAAHRDGSFFKRHIDTLPLRAQDEEIKSRTISAVYYFHASPRKFSGGELALFPLGPGEAVAIEPCDNRLVAFPSFAPHEVRPVVCPTDEFGHARFAVNCWLYKSSSAPNLGQA